MRFADASIPLGHAWSSPFARWQGGLAQINALDVLAAVTGRALHDRQVDPARFTSLVVGMTVPQKDSFYAAPTLAARLGAPGLSGPLVSQACATSVTALHLAAQTVEGGGEDEMVLAVAGDRTSNGPVLIHPVPGRPGGAPDVEHWVVDSFARDPWGGLPMVGTADAVAAEEGFTRDELDALTLHRDGQYRDALANDRAFQRRYMVSVEVKVGRGIVTVDADEGVHDTTPAGLAKLAPVQPDGVVTFGSQTHPADGAAGMVVTSAARARRLGDGGVARILGTGFARVEKARMPKAPVPAAQAALADAGVDVGDVHVIKTHNPFAVNDLYLSRCLGVPWESLNPMGSSLIYGHPQGPTGARGIAELIELLRERGGGIGLFTGCAAGDTGAAVVLRVE